MRRRTWCRYLQWILTIKSVYESKPHSELITYDVFEALLDHVTAHYYHSCDLWRLEDTDRMYPLRSCLNDRIPDIS
jgi:hypothetical protein